ncbi:hypothetical protein CC1G_11189 [Coprinopsis cinerea okayama7|uniref:Uncharacterized protein n=1 Tax=Coprinopsis cinerea (strain Okayama-7 / 130 / ATCC MYA-4618 / FGSC 9003) TaxID=240176 RepID=A8NJR7_COPC7|nr:hypothetical protein CC1G_11189 [Coprinopsis cinerea okayama7\|eukprot:XP_001834276.2 hypothetical protein CC1G_11189 [Coprinopsis cinerea okayama7\
MSDNVRHNVVASQPSASPEREATPIPSRSSDVVEDAKEKDHPHFTTEIDEPVAPNDERRQMSILRIRLWIGFCFAFIVLAPVISIVMGYHLHSNDMVYPAEPKAEFPGRTARISLEVVLVSADPKLGSITLDWSFLRELRSPCSIDNVDACTDVNLFFDAYTAEIVLFAEEVGTNATVGVEIGDARGVAIGFETRVAHIHRRISPPEVADSTIILSRSILVKLYGIISTIAVWIVTLILSLVMITSVFFGYKQRPEVLLIPVATLFAFTTLRQSMPGAPEGFGHMMDLVGLVPCLALLAMTAACSLGVFLLSDPASTKRELRWTNMQEAFPVLKRGKTQPELSQMA